MNIMKKRNIFLGLVLMLGLTGCYDLDKMPEGVLSTTIPFGKYGGNEKLSGSILSDR